MDPFVREINNIFLPWRCKIRNRVLSVRSTVFGSCFDGVEIPKAFNIFSHKGRQCCHICDLVSNIHNRTTYCNRFSNLDYRTAPYTREYRNLLLTRIGTNKSAGVFKGNSNFVDNLLSWFPLSTCYIDSLHVIYEGLFDTLLTLLKKKFPVKFFFFFTLLLQ